MAQSLKSAKGRALERKLLQRLLARAKREKVQYRPFDCEYFCISVLGVRGYGPVLHRTGIYTLRAKVFSVFAPSGEEGEINTDQIDEILTRQQFKEAAAARWPEVWRRRG